MSSLLPLLEHNSIGKFNASPFHRPLFCLINKRNSICDCYLRPLSCSKQVKFFLRCVLFDRSFSHNDFRRHRPAFIRPWTNMRTTFCRVIANSRERELELNCSLVLKLGFFRRHNNRIKNSVNAIEIVSRMWQYYTWKDNRDWRKEGRMSKHVIHIFCNMTVSTHGEAKLLANERRIVCVTFLLARLFINGID